jgi:hypothetical protein
MVPHGGTTIALMHLVIWKLKRSTKLFLFFYFDNCVEIKNLFDYNALHISMLN